MYRKITIRGLVCVKYQKYLFNKINDVPYTRCFSISSYKNQIVKSTIPDVKIPDCSFQDFLFKNFDRDKNKIALECLETGYQYTYDEVQSKSAAFAASLRNTFGAKDGDRVMVILPNIPEYAPVILGTIQANCICTTCNPVYTIEEIKRQYINSNSICIVTIKEKHDLIEKVAQSLGKDIPIILVDNDRTNKFPKEAFSFDELTHRNINVNDLKLLAKPTADDVILLPYSSGTTGLPKGVEITHLNAVSEIMCFQRAFQDESKIFPAGHQAITAGILPFFHIYGLFLTLIDKLNLGGKIVTVPKFSLDALVKLFNKFPPDFLFIVPPILLTMSKNENITHEHLKNIYLIVSGAAPIGGKDISELQKKCGPKPRIIQGYGLTESSSASTIHHDYGNWDKASVGGLIPNVEGKIVDTASGNALGLNQVGELLLRGPQIMKGYYKNAKATTESMTSDGWYRTGDVGYFTENGELYITSRLKELIKVKGFQVAPSELEEILRSHPAILDAAVIGVTDEKNREAPKAFIVKAPNQNLTEADVQKFVASQVAPFKQLTGGVKFIDQIPKSASGKILKLELQNYN